MLGPNGAKSSTRSGVAILTSTPMAAERGIFECRYASISVVKQVPCASFRSRLSRIDRCFRSNRGSTPHMLSPDQVQAAGNHNPAANINTAGREHSPDDAIDADSPQQGRVLKGRDDGRRCISERFGEQVLCDRGKKANGREQQPVIATD